MKFEDKGNVLIERVMELKICSVQISVIFGKMVTIVMSTALVIYLFRATDCSVYTRSTQLLTDNTHAVVAFLQVSCIVKKLESWESENDVDMSVN